jgi:hypothetical protein
MSVATLSETRTYGRRLEYTLEQILPGIKNNIFVHSPGAAIFLSEMFDSMFGSVGAPGMGSGHRVQDGGESIRVQHNLGLNTTAQRLSGPWGTIDTSPSDTVRHSRANWTDYSSTATFNERERLENRNDSLAVANMILRETNHAMLSLVELVAGDVYVTGGPSSVTSLSELISANDTVQGLSGATYSGNSTHPGFNSRGLDARGTAVGSIDFDGATAGTSNSFAVAGVQNFRSAWLNCQEGAVKPNVILTTHAIFSFYEGQITPQERFTNTNIGNLSFENLAFKTAPVMPDPYCDSGSAYFVNTDKVYATVLGGADFDRAETRLPTDQEAFTTPIMWKGNLVVEDRATLNKITSITA